MKNRFLTHFILVPRLIKTYIFRNNLSATSFFERFQRKPKDVSEDSGCSNYKYRSYDGFCNNFKYPHWGSSYTSYTRLLPPSYTDGIFFFFF